MAPSSHRQKSEASAGASAAQNPCAGRLLGWPLDTSSACRPLPAVQRLGSWQGARDGGCDGRCYKYSSSRACRSASRSAWQDIRQKGMLCWNTEQRPQVTRGTRGWLFPKLCLAEPLGDPCPASATPAPVWPGHLSSCGAEGDAWQTLGPGHTQKEVHPLLLIRFANV